MRVPSDLTYSVAGTHARESSLVWVPAFEDCSKSPVSLRRRTATRVRPIVAEASSPNSMACSVHSDDSLSVWQISMAAGGVKRPPRLSAPSTHCRRPVHHRESACSWHVPRSASIAMTSTDSYSPSVNSVTSVGGKPFQLSVPSTTMFSRWAMQMRRI